MSQRIPDHVKEQVQAAVDIVEVIGEIVHLKKSGGSFKGLCPFHREKTPSFNVHPGMQIFHCFGCGEKGDVFSFLMKREGVPFPEAIRILADRAGIPVPRTESGPDRTAPVRKVLEWATAYFERVLASKEGEGARAYFRDRGFDESTIRAFRLGWAPVGWLKVAREQGVPLDGLHRAGLVRAAPEGSDRPPTGQFQRRVIFPIRDPRGQTIGFGARTLTGREPKYLNSPKTNLFDKSRALYGIDRARDAMARDRAVLVVEGYTDCLMAHQAGLPATVATLGTALTADHAGMLKRYVDRVTVLFDADEAGLYAAARGLLRLLPEGLDVRVAILPEGMDPCDLLKIEGGGDRLRKLLGESRDCLAFWLETMGGESPAARARAVDEILAALDGMRDPLLREQLVNHLADLARTPADVLRVRMEGKRDPGDGRAVRPAAPAAGAGSPAGRVRAERLLIGTLLQKGWKEGECPGLDVETFRTEPCRTVARAAWEGLRAGRSGRELLAGLDEETAREAAGMVMAGEILPLDAGGIRQCLDWIERDRKKTERKAHLERLREAEQRGDREAVESLLRSFQPAEAERISV